MLRTTGPRSPQIVPLLILTTTLFTTACGGSAPDPPTSTSSSTGNISSVGRIHPYPIGTFNPDGPWTFDPEYAYELVFGRPKRWGPEVAEYHLGSERATQVAVRDCMTKLGFEYTVPPDDELAVDAAVEPIDRSEIRRDGYSIASHSDDEPAGGPDPNAGPDALEALAGEGGCEERATRLNTMVDGLANEYEGEMSAPWTAYNEHAIVRAAESRWVQCMAAKGVPFASSSDPEDQLIQEFFEVEDTPAATERFRQREITVALADFDCTEPDRAALESLNDVIWAGFERKNRAEIVAEIRRIAEA